jgi:hypothetical protein
MTGDCELYGAHVGCGSRSIISKSWTTIEEAAEASDCDQPGGLGCPHGKAATQALAVCCSATRHRSTGHAFQREIGGFGQQIEEHRMIDLIDQLRNFGITV